MITPFPLNTLTIGEGYSLCTSEIASLALSHVVTKGLDQKWHPKFESLGQPFFDIGKKASVKQQESFGECMLVVLDVFSTVDFVPCLSRELN